MEIQIIGKQLQQFNHNCGYENYAVLVREIRGRARDNYAMAVQPSLGESKNIHATWSAISFILSSATAVVLMFMLLLACCLSPFSFLLLELSRYFRVAYPVSRWFLSLQRLHEWFSSFLEVLFCVWLEFSSQIYIKCCTIFRTICDTGFRALCRRHYIDSAAMLILLSHSAL